MNSIERGTSFWVTSLRTLYFEKRTVTHQMYLYGMCGMVLNPSCYEWLIECELRLNSAKNAYGMSL
jgi:hypothetical protein